jgi:hypothetical protein
MAAGAWEAAAMRLRGSLSLALVLAGCGSATVSQLPPAAGPARDEASLADGRRVALLGRERVVELLGARSGRRVASAPAGIGPTHVACLDRGWCYVTDTRGDALLVYRVGAGIELRRRYRLAGGPEAIAVDHRRRRLLVTLAAGGRRVELAAHGRPHVLRTP